ncbi:MAG: DNA cytosine methyltransferase [Flavobacterium sp.]|uniref:DNA cytosine methyltransferase n=1 Tax=Flavobacterium sp. TaxID=239 RepID=UPI003BCF31C4
MREDLFGNLVIDEDKKKLKRVKQSPKKVNGAHNATSRYKGLKESLDSDIIDNNNWKTVETLAVENDRCDMTFMDLFSGAGGISVGVRNAGFKKLASVEIDKDASNTIRKNFPEAYHFEMPIQDVKEAEIDKVLNGQNVNVVFGGPPCQGFSVAGLRNPNDPRNKLFQEYVRIVKHLKPEFVVLENVPGILTMENGKVYKEIIKQFSDAGYPNMSVRILEAATFGVPQLRTRAIFIANRLGLVNPYPKEILSKGNYKPIESAIDDLKYVERSNVSNHEWTKHSKEMEKRISLIPHGGSLYETFRDAYKRQYKGVPSMTVKENHGGCHVHYELNRVLSAREMARLQTFPDDFIFTGSFKRAYWQIGNAVPCLMAEHIAKAIKKELMDYYNQC